MHTRCFPTVVLGVALLGWTAAIPRLPAQTEVPLLSITNSVWRYYQAGNEPTNPAQPNTRWHTNAFDDSTWSSGLGLFGFESTPEIYPYPFSTPLDAMAPGATNQTLTYYFRTHFSFDNNPTGVVLLATIYLDDGAVFYLNGREITRIRIDPGTVTNATLAYNQSNEGVPDVFSLPVTNLQRGDNVLAVEVHQTSAHSGDVVFGMRLRSLVPEPIQIITPPASQIAAQGEPASFSVEVSGSWPCYQWFKNNTPIPQATNPSYTIGHTSAADARDYFVVVSNGLGSVTSSVARLTVVPDTFPPRLISAEEAFISGQSNLILVTFSEVVMFRTATNPANYCVTRAGTGESLAVTRAMYNGPIVVLSVSPWEPGADYLLTVNNVTDSRSNVIAPNSTIGVGFCAPVNLPLDGVWAWDESGNDLGTAWRQRDYDDSLWRRGQGLFYHGSSPLFPCAGTTRQTAVTYGYRTYYFRAHFPVGSTSGKGIFQLRHMIEDGAIFYLNGQEILRYNLPASAVTAYTPATTLGSGMCAGPMDLTVTNLVTGDNVLAVEVHQASSDDGNIVFGAELTGGAEFPVPEVARLEIDRAEPDAVALRWTGAGLVLQSAPAVQGPWSDLATNSPQVTPATNAGAFYRLRPR